jgi:hypothetical protein
MVKKAVHDLPLSILVVDWLNERAFIKTTINFHFSLKEYKQKNRWVYIII